MFKKAVFLAVLILALSFGSAFALQIDGMTSLFNGAEPATNLFVNPGGMGDALLYGYYNVRGQDQFFTITNTSAVSGARVRIRFREAAKIVSQCNGSQEVLDFDICLSKGDMWTGRISSKNNEAVLTSTDTDTFVQTSGSAAIASAVTGTRVIFSEAYPDGVAFKSGDKNTITDITADNTREGYFEVIAERGLDENCTPGDDCTCGNLRDVQGQDVSNVLMGHTYIVNLGTMETYGYVATALADFSLLDITAGLQTGRPDLTDSTDAAIFGGGITAVNYVLSKLTLDGIYDLESNFGGNTAWIVTFPTKWATHDEDGAGDAASCSDETADIFDDTSVLITIWDDKENQDTPSECEFSPCPGTPGNSLPEEVNVLNIQNSSIFTSDVAKAINFRTASFDFGWMDINLLLKSANPNVLAGSIEDGTAHITVFNGRAAFGLPAIGYQAMKFAGGKVTGMLPLQYTAAQGLQLP